MIPARPPSLGYRLLSVALFFFWISHAVWHAIKHRQGSYFWQRLGIAPGIKTPVIWVHASSVGEVELVKPLIQALSSEHPILLTTFTASGYQHAQRIMPPQILLRVLPIDFFPISTLFFHHQHIKLGLVAETELWPETLFQAQKQATLIQINARLSAKSLHSPIFIKQILQRCLAYFSHHLTRNESDFERLVSMGVDEHNISICGNLKQAAGDFPAEYENLIGQPYILLASTHAPEEQQLVDGLSNLDLRELLVIAPRHPQRAGEILKVLRPFGLNIRQRSQAQTIEDNTGIYLADTLGELKALMAHASLVIMGGSFNETGGHNVLEPARLGKAVITGPSDSNIRQDIEMLLQQQAIIQVADLEQLVEQVQYLLTHPDRLQALGKNAEKVTMKQAHVIQDYLDAINRYLDTPPSAAA